MATQSDTESPTTSENDPEAIPPTHTVPPTAGPRREHRFFEWIRSLGLRRQPGWIGGVCSGIAARLDIDPIIVRGIVVVIAVLGGPAFLFYALAWALLPDQDDNIHVENITRGKVESPVAGIGALVLLSMLPVTQGFWSFGATYWGEPTWGYDLGRALWTVAVLGVAVAFVIWLARRSGRTGAPTVPPASAAPADTTGPTFSPATTDGRPETIPEPLRSDAPAADAPAEELAAWRQSQDEWKAQNSAWKAQQAASQRELHRQRTAEYREKAREASAAAAERRRIRRLENPRLGAATVFAVFGAAIVGGGIAAAAASVGSTATTFSAGVGLAVAALIMGVAIVIGGVLRRRSGFLSFLAGVTLMLAIIATALPTSRTLIPPSSSYGVGTGNYAQLFGNTRVTVYDGMPGGTTDVWQGGGTVHISVLEGTAAVVEVTSPQSAVTLWGRQPLDEGDSGETVYGMTPQEITPQQLPDGVQRWTVTVGDPNATEIRTIRVWQNNGYVEITDENELTTEGAPQ